MRYCSSLLLMLSLLTAACDEPSPQWRDDQAVVDETQTDQSDQTDQADQSDQIDQSDADEPVPDEPVVDCTAASPTAAEKNALQTIFPAGETFCADKTASGVSYFIAVRDGQTVGYAFPGTNYGFDGQIVALTGMTVGAKSIAVAIVSQRESWWYRMGDWFFDQFRDIDITQITLDPKYNKNCYPCSEMYDAFKPFTVDAVSGATYTSNAVTKDVWDALYLYDELFDPPTADTAP